MSVASEGACPTIRSMSVETCSIAIATMDDSKRCVNVVQWSGERPFTYVERSTQEHRSLFRFRVPLSGAIFRSESRGIVDSLALRH